jgi:butyrate kinase
MKILAINPGSTSTKIALYENDKELFTKNLQHAKDELPKVIKDQLSIRLKLILDFLENNNISLKDLSAVVGRGGLLPPVKPGGYLVSQDMLDELESERITPHACNLGAPIASAIATPLGIPAYIYDPVSACSLSEVAKLTGFKEIKRYAKGHVLNSRATARKAAESHGRKYEEMRYVIAHLGGGISFTAHSHGEIIDISSDDDGAFSPERSGGLPLLDVVDMCYSGKYTRNEMKLKIRGEGGLKALLGTTDCTEIEKMIDSGDSYAKLVYEAQAYQIAKGISLMAVALRYQFDAIILTGGMAYSKKLIENIMEYIKFLGPVEVWPGENEMEALALGAYRILNGEEKVNIYRATDYF